MATDKTPWLEYHLEKLAFHNGAVLGFTDARMLYRDDDREIAITQLKTPPAQVDRTINAIRLPGGQLPEIKTIYYEMRVEGYPSEAYFFHPMKKGVGVVLEPRPNGKNVLYFDQRDGRTIFSKDWTLRDVTQGRIPLDRAVWQFHGYQHEH
ncbi:MAG: hypothetical protein ACREDP_20790 [Bradyrhizobium sp.]